MADAPPQVENNTDPEYQKAKKAADLAEQQKRLAVALKDKGDAERALPQSGIPQIPITPLAGTATVDANFTIDGQILAYKEMARLAEEIVGHIATALPQDKPKVILMSEDYVPWIDQYRSIIKSLESLISAYQDTQLAPPLSAEIERRALPLVAVGGVIKTAVDFLSLLRTNMDVKGVAVKIEDMALSAEIAKRLHSKKIEPLYLNPFSLMLLQSGTSDLSSKLSSLMELRTRADQQISPLESKPDRNPAENILLTKLKTLNSQYASLTSNLDKIDDKTGCNQFTQLCKAEKVAALLNATPSPCVLWAKVLTAGGANVTKQNILWTNIFSTGGAVISYFLFDTSGKVLASGVVSGSTALKKFK